jgi:membrane-associated phospholipid phosphatase
MASSDSAAKSIDISGVSGHKTFLRRAEPYLFLAAAGAALFPIDREINKQFYLGRSRGHAADQISPVIGKFGMPTPYFITVPLLAGHGLIWKNKKSLYVAGELVGGILIAGAVTEGIKATLGRERPYQTSSPFEFFDGGSSFYSGHSITAWTFATIIAKNYPRQDLSFIGIHDRLPILPVLMYGAAGLVCVQRLYSHNHWASDVYYGALAGYGAGSLTFYLGERLCTGRLHLAFGGHGDVQICYGFN